MVQGKRVSHIIRKVEIVSYDSDWAKSFQAEADEIRFTTGHPDVERHLNFRDYMIAHPEDAQAYGCLKQEVARRFPTDIDSYIAGKDGFIKKMDRRAQAWKDGAGE